MALLYILANWWFVVVAVSLISNAPVIEAAVQINITLQVDNPTKVLENTPIVHLHWNYSIVGDEELKEVDFHYGENSYIGYIDATRIVVSSKFKERVDLERPGTLIIHNVTASDTGTYVFDVKTTEATKVSSTVYLDVLFEPSAPVQLCPSSVTEGSDVTLYCNATGNPTPDITWIEQGTGKILTSSEQLILTAVNRSQAGAYQCYASNGIGRNSTKTCNLDVLYKPTGTSIASEPANTTLLLDSNLLLNCSTDAHPEAHVYHFYFNDALIGNSSSGVFNVTVKEDGVYTCVPINTVGTGHNASIRVTAVDAPSVAIYAAATSVIEGNNITFSCNASGKPEPVITWTKVGASKVLSQSSSLTIVNVSRPGTPDHMIQYQCTASNGVEKPATATVNITVHFPAAIDSAPSLAYQVVEGNGVILFCNATGNPQPNITWTKQGNNSILSTSETLNLTKLMREDDGSVYKCTVTNYVGSAEATAKITVWYEPNLTLQQCSSPVSEGDNATLHCNATGNPQPNIAWIKTTTRETVSHSEMLFIKDIKRNQSGGYECLAWNGIGNNSTNSCTIDVHYLPTALALSITPDNTTVLQGATLELNCTTDANPAVHIYHFYFNDNLIGNSSLGVFNVTVKEDGVYTCVPINTVGTGHNASISITAVVAPSGNVSSNALIVQEGGNISLTCNASGKPDPKKTWTKLGSSVVLSNTSSLTIVNVSRPGTPDHMIQYQCTASNGVEKPATATVNITVHFSPEIDSAPSVFHVVEGNGVILPCNATGNPQPNITWTKQGNSSILSTSETLNLTKLMREDDESVYKCTATNEVGSAEATAKITVWYEPILTSQQCSSPVTEGDNATLNCNATGNPQPNIAWIKTTTRQTVSHSEILFIEDIKRNQSGGYECLAWNGIGNNSTNSCTIDVHYLPTALALSITPTNTTVLRDDVLSLNCKTDANPAAHIYHLNFNGNLIGNSSLGVFNVTVKEDGVYTCVPINTVGTGHNATVSITAVVAPSVNVSSTALIVQEGGNLSLTCNASGKPDPKIAWTKLGSSGVLSNTSSLTIVNVSRLGTPDHMIQYQCTAGNGVEKPATATVNITVHFSPEIDSAASVYHVVEGNGVILFCNATGNPQPNITWTKQGNSSILSTSETLNLTKLMREDDGSVYKCTATNEVGSAEATSKIAVWFPPKIHSVPSLVYQVVEGNGVILFCNATGNPQPNITWTKQGNNSILSTSETLNLTKLMREDDGSVYKCTGTNYVGSVEATSKITVWFPPEIDSAPSLAYQVVEGNGVILFCNATGNPQPNITWTKQGNNSILSTSETLNLTKLMREDDGSVYKCTVTNEVGSAEATAKITVWFPPEIDTAPSLAYQVVEGNGVMLFCNATGNPQPNITWTKQGNSSILSTSENLNLTKLMREDDGSVYKCTATNEVGSGEAMAKIAVWFPPEIDSAPSLVHQVVEGNGVILFCNATGNPQPNITWTKQGNNSILSTSGTLNLTKLMREDDGSVYKCTATNYVGSAEATAKITVWFPPEIDSAPSLAHQVVEGNGVILFCNATGNPQPNITWTKQGNNSILSTSETLNLTKLMREDDGSVYKCTASNEVGSGEAMAKVAVWFPPEIDSAASVYQVVEGNGVILFCNATGNSQPNITWTKQGNSSILSTSETLNLTKPMREDDGSVYKCTATNEVGSAEATSKITVWFPPEIDSAPSLAYQVVEGNGVILFCNATGNPQPNITWTKQGNNSILSASETLNVTKLIREDDESVYKCTATNYVGSAQAMAKVAVWFSPEIDSDPSLAYQVVEGNGVILFCNATGNPQPNITWTKQGNNSILSTSETLNLTKLVREDDGSVYKCTATNEVGSGEAMAKVAVWFPPEIDSAPSLAHQVVEGNGVMLFCNATGNPQPNITWAKQGNNSILSTSETLNLTKLMREDDESVYKCTGTNEVGSAEAMAKVAVWFSPEIDSAPSLAYQVVEGNGVILFCNATGNPQPNITWTKQGNNSILSTSETLNLTKLMREDDGSVYKCTATNYVGSAEATSTVTVFFPPETAIQECPSQVSEGINVTLHCNVTGNPTPKVAWLRSGEVLLKDSTYFIPAVNRSQTGIYECMAWNGIGNNSTANCVVDVHYAPTATTITTTPSNTTVLHDAIVSLNCKTDANPAAHIYHFYCNGNLIGNSSSGVFNVTVKEDGVYTCVPINTVGTGHNASISITVVVVARAEIVPHTVAVTAGENLTLTCNVWGIPSPSILWTPTNSSKVLSQNSTLTIVNVSRPGTPNKMIQYQCTASNGVETSVTATVDVTVHSRPCSSDPCMKGSCTDLNPPAYQCTCSAGYQGTNCDQPIPQETNSVKGELKLKTEQFQYLPDYKNHSSNRFKELSKTFKDNVTELYKDENQFGHVEVEDIFNGSVVVNFTLVFLKGNKTVEQLVEIFEIAVHNKTIHLLPVERGTLHLMLPTTPAPSASALVPAPSAGARRKEVASWMIALMAGIGGLIFLVLICAIIHCCVYRDKKTKKELCQRYEDETGKWIDLPHAKNGFKPCDHQFSQRNSGFYLEQGPTVNEPYNQQHAVEEQFPAVRTVPEGKPETNGNSTHL